MVKSEIAAAIARTPDVTRVTNTSYSTNPGTRSGAVTYEAASTEGPVSSTVATNA